HGDRSHMGEAAGQPGHANDRGGDEGPSPKFTHPPPLLPRFLGFAGYPGRRRFERPALNPGDLGQPLEGRAPNRSQVIGEYRTAWVATLTDHRKEAKATKESIE